MGTRFVSPKAVNAFQHLDLKSMPERRGVNSSFRRVVYRAEARR